MNEKKLIMNQPSNRKKILTRKPEPPTSIVDLGDFNEDTNINDIDDFDDDISNIGLNDNIDTLSLDDSDYSQDTMKKTKKVINYSVEAKQPSTKIAENKATVEYGSFTAKLSKENITYAKILKATDQIKDMSNFIDNLITEHRNTQNTNK